MLQILGISLCQGFLIEVWQQLKDISSGGEVYPVFSYWGQAWERLVKINEPEWPSSL